MSKFNWKCAFGLHDWGRWERGSRKYKVLYRKSLFGPVDTSRVFEEVEEWQSRVCRGCGKVEEERLGL